MGKKIKHLISLLLVFVMIGAAFAGCTQDKDSNGAKPDPTETAKGNQSTTDESDKTNDEKEPEEEFSYPMDTDVKLTWWFNMNPNVSANYTNAGETEFSKELMKRTGIEIEFMHPTSDEQFGLMVATGDLPDILEFPWDRFYAGGMPQAISDNIILPLNDLMDAGYMPNYLKFLEENPDIARAAKTNEGLFGGLVPVEDGKSVYGPIIRKDWLDDLNLEMPETLDEWYTVLKAFKDEKNASAPFTNSGANLNGLLDGPFGLRDDFYVEDGVIKYGPIEPAFKDYLQLISEWYAEGLIDKDIVTNDGAMKTAKMTNGSSGATLGYTGTLITYDNAGQQTDSNYDVVAAPWISEQKGQKPKFGLKSFPYSLDNNVPGITTKCEAPKVAARLLDYLYSEDGQMLSNFGIEGESYIVEADGTIKPTEKMHNDPEGRSFFHMKGVYTRSYATGPYVRHPQMTTFDLTLPKQWDAVDIWSDTHEYDHRYPSIRSDVADSEEFGAIMVEVNTYKDEMYLQFLLGEESVDKFDQFVAQLKSMGIERAIEIKQKAYDQFNSN